MPDRGVPASCPRERRDRVQRCPSDACRVRRRARFHITVVTGPCKHREQHPQIAFDRPPVEMTWRRRRISSSRRCTCASFLSAYANTDTCPPSPQHHGERLRQVQAIGLRQPVHARKKGEQCRHPLGDVQRIAHRRGHRQPRPPTLLRAGCGRRELPPPHLSPSPARARGSASACPGPVAASWTSGGSDSRRITANSTCGGAGLPTSAAACSGAASIPAPSRASSRSRASRPAAGGETRRASCSASIARRIAPNSFGSKPGSSARMRSTSGGCVAKAAVSPARTAVGDLVDRRLHDPGTHLVRADLDQRVAQSGRIAGELHGGRVCQPLAAAGHRRLDEPAEEKADLPGRERGQPTAPTPATAARRCRARSAARGRL